MLVSNSFPPGASGVGSKLPDDGSTPQDIEYVIYPVCPTDGLYLVSGPNGSGTTAFMLCIASAIAEARTFLGYETLPRPLAFISCHQSLRWARLAVSRLGFETQIQDVHSTVQRGFFDFRDDTEQKLEKLLGLAPSAEVLFVDGLLRLMNRGTDPASYQQTADFLEAVKVHCEATHRTLFATLPESKRTSTNKILNPRDRAYGSVAFGGCAGCMFSIDPNSFVVGEKQRKVYVLPSEGLPSRIVRCRVDESGAFQPGTIVGASKFEELDIYFDAKLGLFLDGDVESGVITRQELEDYAFPLGISRRTVTRWLAIRSNQDRRIFKAANGVYRISHRGKVKASQSVTQAKP